MPSPSKTVYVSPISGNGGNFQSNALDSFKNAERTELQADQDNCAKNLNVLVGYKMAMVMSDKNELQMKNFRDEEKVENKTVKEEKEGLSVLMKEFSNFSNTVWRRGSCEFTTCVSPCVKKATSHLQQLQGQLARWNLSQEPMQEYSMKESVTNDATCISSRDELGSLPNPSSDVITSVSQGTAGLSSVMASPFSDETFSFSGSADATLPSASPLQAVETKAEPPLVKSAPPIFHEPKSVVYQMSYTVVDEVIRLLGRLERDRLSTQQMLVQEKQRVNLLNSEIDRLAFKRLVELPAAVQNEHESCTTDINELKWHCSYRRRLEARIKRRVDHAGTQNAKFIEDVESAKRSCPLVQEKLDLESLAIASIQSKQNETDEELRLTLSRLEATEIKTNEARQRGDQERALIKRDVDVIRNLLNEVSDELAQLKMNYTSNVHTISDINNTLKENIEECHNLEKREEKVKAQEAAQLDKVMKLKEKIAEQAAEHVRLTEENEKLRKENLITEADYQNALAQLKMEIKQYEIQVRELTRRNKTTRDDMDSAIRQIERCKKQINGDQKSLARARQELEKVEQLSEMMCDEMKKVKTLNYSLKASKAHQEEENFTEEDLLRTAENSLKIQLKDEANIRTVLQARIAADTSDLLKSRVDSKKKKEKVAQQNVDAQKILNRIREQVSKLEKVHEQRQQTISQMKEVLDKLAKQRNEMESKYRARIAELKPKEELAKKAKLELEQKLDMIRWQSELMEKKMNDMSSSTVMMTRVVNSTQDGIAELEEGNNEVKLRLQASIETEISLKQALEGTKERSSTRKEEHILHLESRKTVLEKTENLLQETLAENKTLAENYQKLHTRFIQVKEDFLKNYETLVNDESHLKDHKELHALQRHMRECLQHYYRLRGLQNKSQVAQFQLNSQENSDRLFELKEELSNVIKHIHNFLESNNASHKTISMEAAMMAQTPVS